MNNLTVTLGWLCGAMLCAGCVGLAGEAHLARVDPPSEPLFSIPLAWEEGHPEKAAWSEELRSQFAVNLADFEAAMSGSDFCPPYAGLSDAEKVDVLATLAVGIARYESSYNPTEHYKEPPPLGYDSIGLFQLSYEDAFGTCTLDRAKRSLEDPIANIRCTVPEMARLAAADRIIAAGSNSRDARGLARYWSVIRAGPKHQLAEIRGMTRALPMCS